MADPYALGAELFQALRNRQPVPPLKGRVDGLNIDMAYHISQAMLEKRLADGEKIIGRKIGVTSKAVQDMLGVHQPDFGTLTDAMLGDRVLPISRQLIQPRAEGEIAFFLGTDLEGTEIGPAEVLAATATVHPCFEIVDSRIENWKIAIEDTVADNASSGLFVVGAGVSPQGLDLLDCRMDVTKNGAPLSQGFGRAALGSPLLSVAWLANTLARFGVPLRAGQWILSGSLVPLEKIVAGDRMALTITGIGSVEVEFA